MVKGFADTPLLVWALKKTPGNLDRVYFERGIGLNRHWLQVRALLQNTLWSGGLQNNSLPCESFSSFEANANELSEKRKCAFAKHYSAW